MKADWLEKLAEPFEVHKIKLREERKAAQKAAERNGK